MPRVRPMLRWFLACLLLAGCGDSDSLRPDPEEPKGPIPGRPGDVLREVIVSPRGSVLDTLLWRLHDPVAGVGFWERIHAMPREESRFTKVITLQSTVATGSDAADGWAVAPTSVAALSVDSTITAFFAGGSGGSQAPNAGRQAALYTPGTLPVVGLRMTVARGDHTLSVLPGGRVLIAGGYDDSTPAVTLNSAEVFTVATRAFTSVGSMRLPRSYHAAASLPGGKVIITGGNVPTGIGAEHTWVTSTEIFDPATNQFTDGPPMADARAGHSAVALDDGRVLVFGGRPIRSAEIYSPATEAFSLVGDMVAVHGNGHVAVKLHDGRVVVAGGDASANIQPTNAVDIFDPESDTWSAAAPMTLARMNHFAVLLSDGRVLIGGGRGPGGLPTNTAEIFNPVTNKSTRIADMPGSTYDQAAAFVVGRVP